MYAEFEADNENNNSGIGIKTTFNYEQNPVCNGCYIVYELDNVLKSGYCSSNLDYNNEDWFVNEIVNLENKIVSYFQNTNKDIIMTKENEEDYKSINSCRFREKNSIDKVRDHCHLTGSDRRPAHNKCNINVRQKQNSFIPFVFPNVSNYDCHLCFKKLVDKRNDQV